MALGFQRRLCLFWAGSETRLLAAPGSSRASWRGGASSSDRLGEGSWAGLWLRAPCAWPGPGSQSWTSHSRSWVRSQHSRTRQGTHLTACWDTRWHLWAALQGGTIRHAATRPAGAFQQGNALPGERHLPLCHPYQAPKQAVLVALIPHFLELSVECLWVSIPSTYRGSGDRVSKLQKPQRCLWYAVRYATKFYAKTWWRKTKTSLFAWDSEGQGFRYSIDGWFFCSCTTLALVTGLTRKVQKGLTHLSNGPVLLRVAFFLSPCVGFFLWSLSPAGWLGLPYSIAAGLQEEKHLLIKPLCAPRLLMSHWLKQVT